MAPRASGRPRDRGASTPSSRPAAYRSPSIAPSRNRRPAGHRSHGRRATLPAPRLRTSHADPDRNERRRSADAPCTCSRRTPRGNRIFPTVRDECPVTRRCRSSRFCTRRQTRWRARPVPRETHRRAAAPSCRCAQSRPARESSRRYKRRRRAHDPARPRDSESRGSRARSETESRPRQRGAAARSAAPRFRRPIA